VNGNKRKGKAVLFTGLEWPQRVPGSWGSQISWQRKRMVVRLSAITHRPPLHHRKNTWYSFLLEA